MTLLGERDIAQRLCGNLQVDISKTRDLLGCPPRQRRCSPSPNRPSLPASQALIDYTHTNQSGSSHRMIKRYPWDNFPPIWIHANESSVKQHPAYRAAKSGDPDAAYQLVNAQLNSIPEALADMLAQRLDWMADTAIIQTKQASFRKHNLNHIHTGTTEAKTWRHP